MNTVMRRDGRSRGRWLVDIRDVAGFLVRGAKPTDASES
jgi:hypothetical protein